MKTYMLIPIKIQKKFDAKMWSQLVVANSVTKNISYVTKENEDKRTSGYTYEHDKSLHTCIYRSILESKGTCDVTNMTYKLHKQTQRKMTEVTFCKEGELHLELPEEQCTNKDQGMSHRLHP